jgi:hypothetical protein
MCTCSSGTLRPSTLAMHRPASKDHRPIPVAFLMTLHLYLSKPKIGVDNCPFPTCRAQSSGHRCHMYGSPSMAYRSVFSL